MELLTNIAAAYKAFEQNSRSRTFNSIAAKTLDKDFSARGVFAKHGINFYKFMQLCTVAESQYNLVTLYGEQKVREFLIALVAEIKTDTNLLRSFKPATETTEQPAPATETQTEAPMQTAPAPAPAPAAPVAQVQAETPKVEVAPKQVQAGFNLNIDLNAILGHAAKEYLESDAAGILAYVGKRIEEEALKLRPNYVQIGEREPVKIAGKLHKAFTEALEIVMEEKQAYLAGPAGTGKTTLCAQLAEALNVPFGHISCTAGMSEAHLMGRMVADGSYISSEFVELYENGGVFLFDEVDAADPNTLLIINSALANGHMSVPNRKDKPRAKRHPQFYAVCAANTWGNGSNEYAGRQVMDAAFLDRFAVAKVAVDYDRELEKEILASDLKMANTLWTIRENVAKHRIRRVVSTRVFVSAAKQLAAGKTEQQILDRFFTGWTPEEKGKVLAK